MSDLKCSLLRENLQKAISAVSRLVSAKSTLPVLQNILIKSEEGRLKLAATDLEMGMIYFIGAKIDKNGAITVPAKIFSEFVAQNNDEKLDIEVKDGSLVVNSERYKANLRGISADEFPLIPEIKSPALFSLEAAVLREAIPQVVFAAASDESRPILSGVLFRIKDNTLKMVATDSYRLAEKSIELPAKVKGEISLIVPARTLLELARILSLVEGPVNISYSENQILFAVADEIQLISRLIEGQFPAYEQIIPKNYETEAIFETADLSAGIRVASIFARESANNVKLALSPKESLLNISAATLQVGENNSRVKGKIEGKENEISFNCKFVLDVLSVLKDDQVALGIAGKLSPGVIRPVGKEDYVYVIMPLRV
jgi:DNA polymerase-3 subunit beta